MIHYAFSFCQSVEDSQELDENLIDATKRVASNTDVGVILKVRDSLRELAIILESIVAESL